MNLQNRQELPEYACDYCGLASKDCVAQCTYQNCNRWFCNGKGDLKNSSHLIFHLVKCKHKDISLHPESLHGGTVLECYMCGSRNVFLLGFVPLTNVEDKQVIIACRTPCLSNRKFGEMTWDPSEWTALVEERMIVDWLLR